MSSTTYHTFSGPLRWASRLFVPDTTFDPDGVYSVSIKLSTADRQTLKVLGVQLKDRGEGYFTFKRPQQKVFKKGAAPTVLGPPKVYLGNEEFPDDLRIGNESEGTIHVQVYKAGKFMGTRLDKVYITNLIEYNPTVSSSETIETPEEPATERVIPF